jgi:septum formation protein
MKPIDQKIYLASKSPRRRELLRQIGVDFELLLLREHAPRGPEVSEDVLPDEKPEAYVQRVTREKAEAAARTLALRRLPLRPVLTADTTVEIDGKILGKPANEKEAMAMLRLLSGRTHRVLTSVALQRADEQWQTLQISEVTFAPLTEAMMHSYCMSTEPYDKAGGYGIQGTAAVFIELISGSHSGIVGLPLHETAQLLHQAGIHIL